MPIRQMLITIDFDELPASKQEIRDHVKQAILNWGGQCHPTDPFFPTNINKVSCGKVSTRGELESIKEGKRSWPNRR